MRPYYADDACQLYLGDCREVLPQLEAGSVDVCITDPVWPNAITSLVGHEDPAGLFAAAACHLPRLTSRLVVQLGCDSDPRFLASVPATLPFLRLCWLEYAMPHAKGHILYGADVAYAFGDAPRREKWTIIPGRMVSGRVDFKTNGKGRMPRGKRVAHKTHPAPRRLEHVAWLVKWFADGLVLDPFAGSGTTLVAAKYSGLPAVGIEIEERYCEVAARRLEQGVLPLHEPEPAPVQGGLFDGEAQP